MADEKMTYDDYQNRILDEKKQGEFICEKYIDIASNFTRVYKENERSHKAIREVMCLRELFPDALLPIRENDILAGRAGWFLGLELPVDFNPHKESQLGYSMYPLTFKKLKAAFPHRAQEIDELYDFWKNESTFIKLRNALMDEFSDYYYAYGRVSLDEYGYYKFEDPKRKNGAGVIMSSGDTRVGGLIPDFDKLVLLGIPGLRKTVSECEKKNPEQKDYYKACAISLDIAEKTLISYSQEARCIAGSTENAKVRADMTRCADALSNLCNNAPKSFYEAVQLVQIFVILCRCVNFGRLDVVFGDLLSHDLDSGIIDKEEAIRITVAFWQFIAENANNYDSRVYIGGIGRRNEKNADRFAYIAMEATRRHHDTMPVLSLRFSASQDVGLLKKAIECISEGCIYPTLYNDDAYIPGLKKIMHLDGDDANEYAPIGCGEIALCSLGVGSPNSTIKFATALEAALHNGRDPVDNVMIGIETGEPESLDTYEKLEDAVVSQVSAALNIDVRMQKINRELSAHEMSFVFQSLLMDDCLERGRGLLDGGLRYFATNVEGFGMTNTADSLAVIKKLVYDEKKYTLRELVNILDADFEGFDEDKKLFESIAKFGNNDGYVDSLKTNLENRVNAVADKIGLEAGFSWYTIANVNPGGIILGPWTAAGADGRKLGEPLALGNSPMPGCDTSGITSMLLSASKVSPENGGVVTNMNISRETITSDPEKFRALLLAYFESGGLQLNINCFSKGDLEKALIHPEKYRNLIVRVSGYSARFIDLDPITQKHIMERTLY